METKSSEAIEWAFKEYVRTAPGEGQTSKWFPVQWEILELIERFAKEHVQPKRCPKCQDNEGWILEEKVSLVYDPPKRMTVTKKCKHEDIQVCRDILESGEWPK